MLENYSCNTSIQCLSTQRDLALEGLVIAAFDNFDFFLDEEGDVCVELNIDECTDDLPVHSVTFEYLYRYFAGAKGIELTDDEWIIQLFKIEDFIQSLEDEFDNSEYMEEVA